MKTFWLSFADSTTGKNLGVAVVEAEDFLAAVKRTHELGINPGGEVLGSPLDMKDYSGPVGRMLTQEEIFMLGETVKKPKGMKCTCCGH